MATVLILAYYFPPLGMGGTQRAAKFAKYLPEFGWRPVVLTVKDVSYYARDASLLNDVSRVEVVRTGSLDPQRLLFRFRGASSSTAVVAPSGLGHRLNRMFVPDNKILWLPFATGRALRLLRRVDAIFTTSPPHSVHLTGWLLKRLTGVPWVADFRDPWAGGEFQPGRSGWHRRVDSILQRRVLHAADAVIAVSNGLAESLAAGDQSVAAKITVVPNGYDDDDFCVAPAADRTVFTFTFCGALTASRGLRTLLQAAQRLRQDHPDLKWRLRLVGAVVEREAGVWLEEAAENEAIQAVGYRCHSEAIAEMLAADVLVYVVPDHASEGHIPGKTFEYLRAGKPILAIGPEVEGTGVLRRHLPVVSCASQDVDAVYRGLVELTSRKREQVAIRGSIESYSRRSQARRLAEILDQIMHGTFAVGLRE